jgi:hypothetical protein
VENYADFKEDGQLLNEYESFLELVAAVDAKLAATLRQKLTQRMEDSKINRMKMFSSPPPSPKVPKCMLLTP